MIAVDNNILKEAFLEAVMDDRPSVSLISHYTGPISIDTVDEFAVTHIPALILHIYEDRIEVILGMTYHRNWGSNTISNEVKSLGSIELDQHMETSSQIFKPLKALLKDEDVTLDLFKDWYMYEIGNDIESFPIHSKDESIINVNKKFTINEVVNIILKGIHDTLESYLENCIII